MCDRKSPKNAPKGDPLPWGPPCGIPSTKTGNAPPQNDPGRQSPELTGATQPRFRAPCSSRAVWAQEARPTNYYCSRRTRSSAEVFNKDGISGSGAEANTILSRCAGYRRVCHHLFPKESPENHGFSGASFPPSFLGDQKRRVARRRNLPLCQTDDNRQTFL